MTNIYVPVSRKHNDILCLFNEFLGNTFHNHENISLMHVIKLYIKHIELYTKQRNVSNRLLTGSALKKKNQVLRKLITNS